MESTIRPAAALMTGRLVGALTAFLIPVILARFFDQAAFGTYKQLFLVYATLYGIGQCGMAESLFYFLPSDPARAGRYAMNALIALGAAGVLCMAVLWAGRNAIAGWFGNELLAAGLPLVGLHLALMLAATVLEIALTARRRFVQAAWAYALSDVLRTGLLLAPVVLLGGLDGLLLGAVSFAALRLGAAVVLLRRRFGEDFRPDRTLLRIQLGYALPFQAAVLVEILQANLHQYAVSLRFAAAAFAVYAVGCLQVPLVDLVAGSGCNVMMVKMADDLRTGGPAAALATWHDTTRRLALVFFPMVGALLVNARDLIVLLFTANYLGSVPIFMVWTLVSLLAALPTDGVLRVFADTRSLLLLGLVKLLFIAVAAGWWLDHFGLMGGVLVTLIAALGGKGLALWRVKRHLRAGAGDLLPWAELAAIFGCAAIAALPALAIRDRLELAPLPSVIACGFAYGIACAALLPGLRLLRPRRRLATLAGTSR